MEEAALSEPAGGADIFDACGGIALGADHMQGRAEGPCLRFVPWAGRCHDIPMSWYESRALTCFQQSRIEIPPTLWPLPSLPTCISYAVFCMKKEAISQRL